MFSLNRDDTYKYDAEIWGPHYWFFLFTVALSYPIKPNTVTKRKYYDFISNFPLFIPDKKMGDQFSNLLDKYPVTPYLDSRESFVRWIVFIHNKINVILQKEEITLLDALDNYFHSYLMKNINVTKKFFLRRDFLLIFIALMLILFIVYCYR